MDEGVVTAGLVVAGLGCSIMIWRTLRRLAKQWVDKAEVDHTGFQLAVVGDVFADIVVGPLQNLPTWGTDTLVESPIKLMLGGSAGNLAIHASNLLKGGMLLDDSSADPTQHRCILHSSIGTDEMGQFIRAQLKGAGVRVVERRPAATQGACIVLSGQEDRAFVTHRGSSATLCLQDLDTRVLLGASHVHVAGYFNCPKLWPDLPALLKLARNSGATTSMGPQHDATGQWRGELEPLWPLLDVFMPNREEATAMSGRDDPQEAADYFLSKGVELVVITLGAEGAMAVSQDPQGAGQPRRWSALAPKVQVTDTTGAGDAFAAGFLCAWKITGDVERALRTGCALGAAIVTKFGASVPLTDAEVRQHLSS